MYNQPSAPANTKKNRSNTNRYDFIDYFFLDDYELKGAKDELKRLLRAGFGEISLKDENMLSAYITFNKEMLQLMEAVSQVIRKEKIPALNMADLTDETGNLRQAIYLPSDRNMKCAWDWLPKYLSLEEISNPVAVCHAVFQFKPQADWPETFEELFLKAFTVDCGSPCEFLTDSEQFLTMQEHLFKFLEASYLLLIRHLNTAQIERNISEPLG